MKTLAIFFIRGYQRFISPLLPATCRYSPSCSHYGLDALSHYGFFRGGFMTIWRIMRCNPFCKGGYDPVPEKPSSKSSGDVYLRSHA